MTKKDKDTIFQLALLFLFLVVIMVFIFATMASAAEDSFAAKAAAAEQAEISTISEPEPEEEIDGSENDPDFIYLGEFSLTGYCSCSACCGKWANPDDPRTASGTTPQQGRTVGADWNTLPAGTHIYIDGWGEYIVEDKVAGWIADRYDGMIIDLYRADHDVAQAVGRQTVGVWILEGGSYE